MFLSAVVVEFHVNENFVKIQTPDKRRNVPVQEIGGKFLEKTAVILEEFYL